MTNPNGDYQPDYGENSGASYDNNQGQQYNPYNPVSYTHLTLPTKA